MLIQLSVEMPIHWQVEDVEMKSIILKKKHELIELINVGVTDFYEKVCHKTKSITFTGRIELFSTGETINYLHVNTDERELALILKNKLKDSTLIDFDVHFRLSNEERIGENDLSLASIYLTDNMLRKIVEINPSL